MLFTGLLVRCCAGLAGPGMRTLPAGRHIWHGGPHVQIGEHGGPEMLVRTGTGTGREGGTYQTVKGQALCTVNCNGGRGGQAGLRAGREAAYLSRSDK